MQKEKIKGCILIYLAIALFSVLQVQSQESFNIYRLNAHYTILNNETVRESLEFTFDAVINESMNFSLSKNISDVIIRDEEKEINFSLFELEDMLILSIPINESLSKVNISYISKSEIFKKDSVNLFITDFPFEKTMQKATVIIDLPPGYSVYQNEYSPKDPEVLSDGEAITLRWELAGTDLPTVFSVMYSSGDPLPVEEAMQKVSEISRLINFFKIILPTVIVIFLIGIALLTLYYHRKSRKDFLTGFREDERKAIIYLQNHRNTWQNNLVHEFGFSRAKATRIVKKLERRGLVRKEEYGRTNKLHWLK